MSRSLWLGGGIGAALLIRGVAAVCGVAWDDALTLLALSTGALALVFTAPAAWGAR